MHNALTQNLILSTTTHRGVTLNAIEVYCLGLISASGLLRRDRASLRSHADACGLRTVSTATLIHYAYALMRKGLVAAKRRGEARYFAPTELGLEWHEDDVDVCVRRAVC